MDGSEYMRNRFRDPGVGVVGDTHRGCLVGRSPTDSSTFPGQRTLMKYFPVKNNVSVCIYVTLMFVYCVYDVGKI